jgi:hypothetical protein
MYPVAITPRQLRSEFDVTRRALRGVTDDTSIAETDRVEARSHFLRASYSIAAFLVLALAAFGIRAL